ncbi:MAG TPA: DUF883 C-terminal domain-containing protein [Rhizomicrobium sp.]|jgi:ElaB/YqjD/DUF883 family membrane-anchored ribosome-binding protein|nr:DUF883 C-terminal domain-containing protein [Rhizomicrobium sp.]
MGIFRRRRKDVQILAAQLEELQSELSTLRKDARNLATGVSEAAGAAVSAAGAACDDMGKWTVDNIGSMRSSVRDQPLMALVISLGVGAILGALLLRRPDEHD